MNKNAYYKAETRLIQKKEDLFKQGNILRWEMSPDDQKKYDKNELLKNKDLAFTKMMFKVVIFKKGKSTCNDFERKLRILRIPSSD
jgi:hypothetical protein